MQMVEPPEMVGLNTFTHLETHAGTFGGGKMGRA